MFNDEIPHHKLNFRKCLYCGNQPKKLLKFCSRCGKKNKEVYTDEEVDTFKNKEEIKWK